MSSADLIECDERFVFASNDGIDRGDAVEGWTVVTEEPTRGRLSVRVWRSLQDPEPDPATRDVPDRALDARISTACAAKAKTQPYCRRSNNQQRASARSFVAERAASADVACRRCAEARLRSVEVGGGVDLAHFCLRVRLLAEVYEEERALAEVEAS